MHSALIRLAGWKCAHFIHNWNHLKHFREPIHPFTLLIHIPAPKDPELNDAFDDCQ